MEVTLFGQATMVAPSYFLVSCIAKRGRTRLKDSMEPGVRLSLVKMLRAVKQ